MSSLLVALYRLEAKVTASGGKRETGRARARFFLEQARKTAK